MASVNIHRVEIHCATVLISIKIKEREMLKFLRTMELYFKNILCLKMLPDNVLSTLPIK